MIVPSVSRAAQDGSISPTTVFAVKTDKVDLKANTSAAVVGFTRTFATAASRYGSIEWSPRGATHVHATWRTLGRATVAA